jgi:hypothetical protein
MKGERRATEHLQSVNVCPRQRKKRRKRKEEKTGIDAAPERGSGGKQEGDGSHRGTAAMMAKGTKGKGSALEVRTRRNDEKAGSGGVPEPAQYSASTVLA